MNTKEKALLRRVFEISSMVVSNVNERNIDHIKSLLEKLEKDLTEITRASATESRPIWRNFSNMTEEEIRREFSNIKKYPDLKSIKFAVKGFLEMRKVSKVKTRETLVEHIIAAYRKREHIGKLGR